MIIFKKIFSLIVMIVCVSFFTVCDKDNDNPVQPTVNYTSVTGEYFGQTPPGDEAVRFAVGEFLANSQWFWHGTPVFSPDGKEVYFGKYFSNSDELKIYYSKMINEKWTMPQNIPFAPGDGTNNPIFSTDGNTLYFMMHNSDNFIYKTRRTDQGWASPMGLDIPIPDNTVPGWQFSITNNGKIYFELWGANWAVPPDIYVSEYSNGTCSNPVKLDNSINSELNEFCPFVHPNDEYVLFVSNRAGGFGMHDIYISFHKTDGSWTDAINMGNKVNTSFDDVYPYLSPDGNYLFFTTAKSGDQGYNPYWISASIIDELKPNGL